MQYRKTPNSWSSVQRHAHGGVSKGWEGNDLSREGRGGSHYPTDTRQWTHADKPSVTVGGGRED